MIWVIVMCTMVLLSFIIFLISHSDIYKGVKSNTTKPSKVQDYKTDNKNTVDKKEIYAETWQNKIDIQDKKQVENKKRYYYSHEYTPKNIQDFPEPLDLEITYDVDKPLLPVSGNVSTIYIWSNNASNITVYDPVYTLTWGIVNTVEKLEIIWDGDMESYLLKNFEPWDREFQYNIDTKFDNIVEWKNRYLIRWYTSDNGKVHETIVYINYIPRAGKVVYLEEKQQALESHFGWNDVSEYFLKETTSNYTTYQTLFKYNFVWKQILKINDDLEIIVLSDLTENQDIPYDVNTYIRWNENSSNKVKGGNIIEEIKHYKNNDILLIFSSGHEWVASYYLYDSSKNTLHDIYKDFVQYNDGKHAYGIYEILSVSDDSLSIKEHRYCCDDVFNFNWHEILTFDINSREIISRKNIVEIDYTGVKLWSFSESESSIYVSARDYGYDAIVDEDYKRNYQVINPEVINDYIVDNELEDLYVFEAKIRNHDLKYIEIVEILRPK